MKFIVAAALAFAGAAIAAKPYPCYLSQDDASDIVARYSSILTNTTYKGMYPIDTVVTVIADDYVEMSDSILSLVSKTNTLGDGAAPAAVGRDQWYNGVTQHPIPVIKTKDIFVAGENNVLWYWTFEGVGINTYPITGFNLLRIDEDLRVYEADIEFNSIAWGIDAFELQQYCS